MSRRSSHFRFLALVGIVLLSLAGVADAMGGKACPHHAHDDAWHGPSPTEQNSGNEDLEGDSHHAGHSQGHSGQGAEGDSEEDGHDAPECDCGFLCTSVSTPLVVQTPQSGVDISPLVTENDRGYVSQDHEGNLSALSIPFFLPYSNGPPVEA